MDSKELKALYTKGRLVLINKHAEQEAQKLGNLRGGSAGIIEVEKSGKEVAYGACMRKAHLRQMGINIPVPESTYRIFDEGIYNEDMHYALLDAGWEGEVKREEEMGIKYTLSNGTNVTGRPDVVLCKDDGTPVHGIELKKKLTFGGVLGVSLNCKPASAHLIQAAHYSIKLGELYGDGTPLPYSLVYTNGSVFRLDSDFRRNKVEEAISSVKNEVVEYQWGKPANIVPHSTIYDLTWNSNGNLVYYTEGMSAPVTTIIHKDKIEDYFNVVDVLAKNKELGPRPTGRHVGDKVKADSYTECSFCELKATCDNYEKDYDEWLDHVLVTVDALDWTKQ